MTVFWTMIQFCGALVAIYYWSALMVLLIGSKGEKKLGVEMMVAPFAALLKVVRGS